VRYSLAGIDTVQIFPGNFHEPWKASPRTDKDSVKFFKNTVNRSCFPDGRICSRDLLQSSQIFDFPIDDCLRKSEFGNSVHQNGAHSVQASKIVTEMTGLFKSPAKSDRPVRRRQRRLSYLCIAEDPASSIRIAQLPICKTSCQGGRWLPHRRFTEDTVFFALFFLRTTRRTQPGNRFFCFNTLTPFFKLLLGDAFDERRISISRDNGTHSGFGQRMQGSAFRPPVVPCSEGDLIKIMATYFRGCLGISLRWKSSFFFSAITAFLQTMGMFFANGLFLSGIPFSHIGLPGAVRFVPIHLVTVESVRVARKRVHLD